MPIISEAKDRAKSFAVIGVAFGLRVSSDRASPACPKTWAGGAYFPGGGMSLVSIVCTLLLLPGGVAIRAQQPDAALPGGKRLSILEWRSYRAY